MLDFNVSNIDLPIVDIIPNIESELIEKNTIIIHAPPGAGKSTIIPIALMNSHWLRGKKIVLLEPRRLAAKSIALRMAEIIGENVGDSIGYRIRFDTKISNNTVIEVVTEGILTKMLQSDNALEDVGLVIFDEFHERNIHADIALALCRESQSVLREDLRVIIMSATLDTNNLPKLLNAPLIESNGRLFPVDIKYSQENIVDWQLMPLLIANKVKEAIETHEGDILVFLPGQREILMSQELLKKNLREVVIHPLYGLLPYGKQKAALLPDKNGKRKVVLATSIAETSLTIEGIKIVIDSGLGRLQKFDPRSGLSKLETIQISKDTADQRAGRAGRLSEGICYRMWSNATQERMPKHRTPEIEDSDLSSLVLEMACWGISNINDLTWLTPPPTGAYQQALNFLKDIGAIKDERITDHGKSIHKIPCHPRIAHMLTIAEENELLPLATDLAALLEERDPLSNEKGIDINLRIEALRRFRSQKFEGRKLANIEKIANSHRKIFGIKEDNTPFDSNDTGLLIASAFPERIAFARPGNNAQYQLANGRYAMANHKDDLAWKTWLAIANLDARDGMGKIFLASPLNHRDLKSMVKQEEVIEWSSRKGGLITSKDLRIGNIVLKSSPLLNPNSEKVVEVILKEIKKNGKNLLDFNDSVIQWQNRVNSLRKWNPDEKWPNVTTDELLQTSHIWLSPYLNDVETNNDLKDIDLKKALHYHLPSELQVQLDELAPERIKVPSGSNLKIEYQTAGKQPILAVRLQEIFGLSDTPKLNRQKNNILLHILSPGFKPVQITSDLNNFWKDTYFEVRKELKQRYPKHEWPDDPTKAIPIKGVIRKKK